MKIEKFEKKDGSEGQNYWLEEGDVFSPKFNVPRETKLGQYMKYSVQVVWEGKEIFLSLTKGQASAMKTMAKNKDLVGTTIKAEKYTNDFGEFVGIKAI